VAAIFVGGVKIPVIGHAKMTDSHEAEETRKRISKKKILKSINLAHFLQLLSHEFLEIGAKHNDHNKYVHSPVQLSLLTLQQKFPAPLRTLVLGSMS
jgi:hypothetical protein